jgi:superfamily I DNA/RNA helicase
VIVDEAQDLTPMQLRMVARRARRLADDPRRHRAGDGPGRPRALGGVLAAPRRRASAEVEELRHAYRVPAEIMELALPLLDAIAPDVEPPSPIRTGGAPPARAVARTSSSTRRSARRSRSRARGLLAVILPTARRRPRGHSAYDDGIPLLSPRQAKGLEFDHVVVCRARR